MISLSFLVSKLGGIADDSSDKNLPCAGPLWGPCTLKMWIGIGVERMEIPMNLKFLPKKYIRIGIVARIGDCQYFSTHQTRVQFPATPLKEKTYLIISRFFCY